MTGFTGVRWEARSAERLSRDLANGAGSKPLFEAGMSWAAVGATLRELSLEIDHLKKIATEGWQGHGADGIIRAISELSRWAHESADMATHAAASAERQAFAHSMARASMPDADTITALNQLETAMKAVAAPAGSMIAGGIAKLDEQAVGVKAQAARVMQTYEHATAPMAQPMHPVSSPRKLVSSAPADTVKNAAEQKISAQEAAGVSMQQAMLAKFVAMPGTTLGTYASNQYVSQTRKTTPITVAEGDAVLSEAQTQTQTHVIPPGPMGAGIAQTEHATSSPVSAASETNRELSEAVAPRTHNGSPSVIGEVEDGGPS